MRPFGFSLDAIGARIAEQDPPLPSQARLSGTSGREDVIFARQLRGDLDSIVMKALAHDPAKRYPSMCDLIADLNRYLAGEVVQSRRSNWSHRVSKLLRRHRRSLAELLAVCCFIALTTGLLYAWHHERARGTQLRDELRGMVGFLLPLPEDLPGSSRERGMLFENFLQRIESAWPNVASARRHGTA